MTYLKPCPFCGGKATMTTSGDGFTSIGCLNDHSIFGTMVQGSTAAEAVEKWNTRYDEGAENAPSTNENDGKHRWTWPE